MSETRIPKKPATSPQHSRRDFLRFLGTAAVGAFFHEPATHPSKEPTPSSLEIASDQISTTPLEGEEIVGLHSLFTGIEGKVGTETRGVDFSRQLDRIWEKKYEKNSDLELRTIGHDIMTTYRTGKKERMTLSEYRQSIAEAIDPLQQPDTINWNSIAEKKGLNQEQSAILQEIAQLITPDTLLAYSLTELFPKEDVKKNILVLDFLLRQAGANYIASIPSCYDRLLSFGPYQLTRHAVYTGTTIQRGASLMNTAVEEAERIPPQLIEFSTADHHRAAYLFAINNMAELLKQLKEPQLSQFAKKIVTADNLLACIAALHHQPTQTITNAKQWVMDRRSQKFEECCSGALKEYATVTKENLQELRMYFPHAEVEQQTKNI